MLNHLNYHKWNSKSTGVREETNAARFGQEEELTFAQSIANSTSHQDLIYTFIFNKTCKKEILFISLIIYVNLYSTMPWNYPKGCLPNKKRKNFQTSVKIQTYPTLLTTFLTIFNFDKKLRKLPPPSLCQFGQIFVFS